MPTYVIGDVQGCFDPLQRLLAKIHFDPAKDTLWFTGDLVNRGPDSLKTLRFIRELPNVVTVLGNHDLHLLATVYSNNPLALQGDTLNAILQAEDKEDLCHWLRQQPLLHVQDNHVLVHAGIYPHWTLQQALTYAGEVERVLRSDNYFALLSELYGNEPAVWDDNLTGIARWRFIINAFTRMRFCNTAGRLDLDTKLGLGEQPDGYFPWFSDPARKTQTTDIYFGHWASLKGKTHTDHVYALDTGCVWGEVLTAMRLEDGEIVSVK